jgi:hypothetical protein
MHDFDAKPCGNTSQGEWLAMTDILERVSVMLFIANGMTICLIASCLDLVGENGFLF